MVAVVDFTLYKRFRVIKPWHMQEGFEEACTLLPDQSVPKEVPKEPLCLVRTSSGL